MAIQAGALAPITLTTLTDDQLKLLETAFTARRHVKAARSAIREQETAHKRQISILKVTLAQAEVAYEQAARAFEEIGVMP